MCTWSVQTTDMLDFNFSPYWMDSFFRLSQELYSLA